MKSSSPTSSQTSTDTPIGDTNDLQKAYTLPGKPLLLFSSLPYYTLYLLYFLTYVLMNYYQNPYWTIALIFVGIPLLDYLSQDWLNPDSNQTKELENNFWFLIPMYGLVVLDNVFVVWSMYYMTVNDLPFIFYPGAILVT